MSLASGDRYLKPYVISEPEVTITPRSPDDECVILASDGLWDVMSSETACDIARRCLTTQSATAPANSDATSGGASGDETAAATAAALEAAKAAQEEGGEGGGEGRGMEPAALAAAVLTKLALAKGSGDNISVAVVDLRATQKRE